MTRWLVSLMLMVVCAGGAVAQDVRVRGGEHDGFTRLALDLPRRVSWQIEAAGRTATVTLSGGAPGFDLSQVFARITRERLRAAEPGPDPGQLTLRLGCECTIDSFLHDGRMLVIDIADPPDPPPSAPRFRNAADSLALPLLPGISRRWQPLSIEGVGDEDLHLVERRLAEEIGRAATQALLTPSVRSRPDTPSPPVAAAPDGRVPTTGVAAQVDTRQPFIATAEPDAPAGAPPAPRRTCLPDEYLDFTAWSDGTPYAQQIARHRLALYREFDRPDSGAAAALARLYLHMGFGAEAAAVLPLAAPALRPGAGETLGALARILDGAGMPAVSQAGKPAFSGQAACPGPAALWSVLEAPAPSALDSVDTDAVRRAFQALPMQLRRHLAPDLVTRLRQADRPVAATSILRTVERLTPGSTPGLDVARAEGALAEGRPSEAERLLGAVASGTSAEGPRALVALVEARVADGRPVAPETAQLAGSYAREYRDHPLGEALRRAHVLALAGSGDLDSALSAFDAVAEAGYAIDAPGTLGPLWSAVAAAPDETAFLRRVIARGDAPAQLPPAAAEAVAARLLKLGFPEIALSWLNGETPEASRGNAPLLRAQAALQLARPQDALLELRGLEGPGAERLRARAHMASADPVSPRPVARAAHAPSRSGASQLSKQSRGEAAQPVDDRARPDVSPPIAPGESTGAARPDLRPNVPSADPNGGLQEAARDAGAPARASAATRPGPGLSSAPSDGNFEEDSGILARNRALIEESAATRAALEELLARVPGPVAANGTTSP
ncbi:hypothetical protein DRV85_11820 [Rhodosalinus halophilus]|uniref:Uncharacterized protein n=1 Tax=Rhodosalinus halophilus TaxID=2259333 RepID=A0A365U7D9_9RHOB|nr:hypothetical protein [Rhodosalinus halophilus]RBI84635.1 hypothetical protein DRV85_11820 [Rhodosalinus halophilus]